MRIIEYARDGKAIADLDCEEVARRFLKDADAGDALMKVSTEVFITVVRALHP